MERIDEFRNMLLVHISELDIKPLVKEINYHPEYFPDIYQPSRHRIIQCY